jgi:hypothetical protein
MAGCPTENLKKDGELRLFSYTAQLSLNKQHIILALVFLLLFVFFEIFLYSLVYICDLFLNFVRVC